MYTYVFFCIILYIYIIYIYIGSNFHYNPVQPLDSFLEDALLADLAAEDRAADGGALNLLQAGCDMTQPILFEAKRRLWKLFLEFETDWFEGVHNQYDVSKCFKIIYRIL